MPGRFPNLLVNGASGIAVGLATNIPPHNITEAISGVIAYIDKPSISLADMMKIIRGPDFPSGGFLVENELVKAYETGRGKVMLRAKVHFENGDNDKKLIVIDELPYQVNKAALLENILKIREEKKGVLAGISEITDESDRTGMRAVIKIKKDFDAQEILDALFVSTNLQTTFGINMVAIAGGKPQQMGLLDIIAYYVDYQREVIYRRTKFELDQVKERVHILEGLVIAVKNIDEVIKIIKTSQNTSEARERLRKRFALSERQAQAILDLRLARLTHLEIFKLEKELEELRIQMERLAKILASKTLQMDVVKTELMQIMRVFKEQRKTQIIKNIQDYLIENESEEKLIEDSVIAISAFGDIKRMSAKHFSMATKAFTENSTKNEICDVIVKVNANEKLLCFTNLGNCYKLLLEDIPESKWRERGTKLPTVITELLLGEKIIFAEAIGEQFEGNLLFYTKDGMVKKTAFSEYNLLKSSFQAIKLKDNDEVIKIEFEETDCTLLFVTEKGMCLNAEMTDIPSQGRVSGGVKGIQLASDDIALLITQVESKDKITVITNAGFCKNVNLSEIETMARYRKGVKIIDLSKSGAKGKVVFSSVVSKANTVIVQYENGDLTAYKSDLFKVETRTHAGRPIAKGNPKITSVYTYNDNFVKA